MRARARASQVALPAMPRALAGRHAKGRNCPDLLDAEFDFRQPFEVDLGRAAVIAEWLRESGFPFFTADVVTAELARPERERGIIGRFAGHQLERAGWRP
jgi:hypothetical protein